MPSAKFVLTCDRKRISVSRWRNLQDDLWGLLRDGRDAFIIIDDRAIDTITVFLNVASKKRIKRAKLTIHEMLAKHLMQGDVTITLGIDEG